MVIHPRDLWCRNLALYRSFGNRARGTSVEAHEARARFDRRSVDRRDGRAAKASSSQSLVQGRDKTCQAAGAETGELGQRCYSIFHSEAHRIGGRRRGRIRTTTKCRGIDRVVTVDLASVAAHLCQERILEDELVHVGLDCIADTVRSRTIMLIRITHSSFDHIRQACSSCTNCQGCARGQASTSGCCLVPKWT